MRSKIAWSFAAATALVGTGVAAKSFSDWSAPVNAETLAGSSSDLNTASNDGCPILNPYDESLYMASNRPGGQGGLDIWIAPRSGDGWGTPVNAGPAINTAADEFCPTPARGNRFFFVRRLSATNTDIYVVKHLPNGVPVTRPTGSRAPMRSIANSRSGARPGSKPTDASSSISQAPGAAIRRRKSITASTSVRPSSRRAAWKARRATRGPTSAATAWRSSGIRRELDRRAPTSRRRRDRRSTSRGARRSSSATASTAPAMKAAPLCRGTAPPDVRDDARRRRRLGRHLDVDAVEVSGTCLGAAGLRPSTVRAPHAHGQDGRGCACAPLRTADCLSATGRQALRQGRG